jgi:hypothetical protein
METKKQNQSLLQEFLRTIEQIPSDIVTELLKVTSDEDEKNIINAFAPTLNNQFKEVSLYLNELSAKATKQKLSEVEKFLKISSSVSLAKNLKIALPSIGSIVGKLGIDGIIKEIKKIIMAIFDILGIKLPKWVITLINLIDEIIADLFGGGSIKLKSALSQAEQNYLAELTQLAKLEKARNYKIEEEEEED